VHNDLATCFVRAGAASFFSTARAKEKASAAALALSGRQNPTAAAPPAVTKKKPLSPS